MKVASVKKSSLRRRVLSAFASIVIGFAAYVRADLTVSGALDLSFNANFDASNNVTGYGFAGITFANLQFNVPSVTVPIGILPFYRDGSLQYWSSPGIYDNLTLDFVNAVNVDAPVANLLNGSVSVSGLSGVVQTLQSLGPTEKDVSVPIPFFSQWFADATQNTITASAGLKLKFDVTLGSGAYIVMDQTGVTLEKLTVNSGATLIANSSLDTRTDLVNHGIIDNLGGTIEGNFYNDGDTNSGNHARIASSLNLQGQLLNSGRIYVDSGGSLNLTSWTGNTGTIVVEGGALSPSGQFTNTGTIQLTSGSVDGSGTLINQGTFQFTGGSVGGSGTTVNQGGFVWSGGTITGSAGLVNTSTNFAISGSGVRDSIDGQSVLSNYGVITQIGTAGVWFNSKGGWGEGASTLNNSAGGIYNLAGDGGFNNGSFYNWNQGGYSYDGYGTGVVNNAGTFLKSAGSGTSTIAGNIAFNNTGTVEVDSGTLQFNGGYTQTSGGLVLKGGSVSAGTLNIWGGEVIGSGTILGNVLNDGTISLGSTLGNLSISGNLTLESTNSKLKFKIGGLTPGLQFDTLSVNGAVSLNGNLSFSLINGFTSLLGNNDEFTLLTANSITGLFSNVANGDRWTTDDGTYSFLVNYGSGSAFGANLIVLSGAVAVPEPGTWMLFLLGGLLLFIRRIHYLYSGSLSFPSPFSGE